MNKLNILIVDDSHIDSKIIIDLLTETGYETFYRVEERLDVVTKLITTQPYDFIICDYYL